MQIEIDEQKLNQKLAEWRWSNGKRLAFVPSTGDVLWGTKEEQCWVNFPKSLDACFKHLVPKAIQLFGSMQTYFLVCDAMFEAIDKKEFSRTPAKYDGEPALALCVAIEKVIGSESKDCS